MPTASTFEARPHVQAVARADALVADARAVLDRISTRLTLAEAKLAMVRLVVARRRAAGG